MSKRKTGRASNGHDRGDDHQRPQAESKPAAFAFRRIGFRRLGLHGRIIRRRGQPEQEILAAAALAARDCPPAQQRGDQARDRFLRRVGIGVGGGVF